MVIRKVHAGRRRGAVLLETSVDHRSGFRCLYSACSSIAGSSWTGTLLNNAAREGCRYALANNTSTTITTTVQSIVTSYMAGETKNFSNFTVTVSGTHLGVSTPVNSLEPR